MAFDERVIALLDAEIARLTKMRQLLIGTATARPKAPTSGAPVARRKRRKMSAAARKRIAQSAKKRWAEAKKAGRNSLGKS